MAEFEVTFDIQQPQLEAEFEIDPTEIEAVFKLETFGSYNFRDGLHIDSNNIVDVIPATTTAIGGIIVGDNLTITEDGILSAEDGTTAWGEIEGDIEDQTDLIEYIVPSNIPYENPQYPAMHSLQDAMDKLLYITPTVSIRGGGNYEIGATINQVNLSWTWNKSIQSQSLNQGIGELDKEARSYSYMTPISSNTTFTITGTDGTNSKSASTSVLFYHKRYWGASAKTSLEDADILALTQELSATRQQTRTIDCSGGKYFYFVIKTSYCDGIKFKVGGLFNSDFEITTRDVVNAQGYTTSYNIYRSGNIQTGAAISVEVL